MQQVGYLSNALKCVTVAKALYTLLTSAEVSCTIFLEKSVSTLV